MTLREFAFRVALPRELILGVLINLVIMWLIFGGQEAVPLLGWLSVMAVVAPAAYCSLAFPTFFAIAEGVKRRTKGKSPPPLDPKFRWIWLACWRAFCRGAPSLAIGVTAVLALDHYYPTLTVPGWVFVVFVPLIATPIGALVFIRTLLSTERLGKPAGISTTSE